MEAVKFTDVNFTYPLCEKKALDNINLSVDMSEFIVLCGKSGCGKSTLLRHLREVSGTGERRLQNLMTGSVCLK